jgi:hypothetical protein
MSLRIICLASTMFCLFALSACSVVNRIVEADVPGSSRHAYCGLPSAECRAEFFHKLDQA